MREPFYKQRLTDKFGLTVLTPSEKDMEFVDRVIYEKLCTGNIFPKSRSRYSDIIQSLADHGAQGIILGCTEIPLLVKQRDTAVPLFDTTRIHAEAAVDYALAED